jgi:hypothetical protein
MHMGEVYSLQLESSPKTNPATATSCSEENLETICCSCLSRRDAGSLPDCLDCYSNSATFFQPIECHHSY